MTQLKEVLLAIPEELAKDPKALHEAVYRDFSASSTERTFIYTVEFQPFCAVLVRSDRIDARYGANTLAPSYDPEIDTYDFRIIASPVKRAGNGRNKLRALNYSPVDFDGRRDWLGRQGERHGFTLEGEIEVSTQAIRIAHHGNMIIDRSIFQGQLRVTDHTAFAQAYATGIGRNKAYGYGLIQLFQQ